MESLDKLAKVNAINTYIISQTTYYLRAACPVIKWVTDLDSIICASLKRGLSLPLKVILCAISSKGPRSVLSC